MIYDPDMECANSMLFNQKQQSKEQRQLAEFMDKVRARNKPRMIFITPYGEL